MSFGKPVLATRAGGVPEVLRHGKDGFLFKAADVAGFSAKLKFLMKNPKLAEQLGRQARQEAREKFSAEKIVNKYLNYYRRILRS